LGGPLLSWISSMLWHQLEPALWVAGASLILAGMLVLRRRT